MERAGSERWQPWAASPLVELRRIYPGLGLRLFAKLEALNPGGSIKDRPALEILEAALRDGESARRR